MLKQILTFFTLLSMTLVAPALAQEQTNHDGSKPYPIQRKEVVFERDGLKIAGVLYLPMTDKPVPAIILSHGFGGNYAVYEWGYCPVMAQNGIAACAFDFCGGGRESKSDGKSTEMSVLTEAKDLSAVLDAIRKTPEIDPDNVFLLGESQGGFVSSYVAASRPDDVRGLVAVFPAYVIQDDAKKRAPNLDKAPDTMDVMGMKLGKIYNADAQSFDIYEMLPNFKRNVLIMHGTVDTLVPISYSERAVKAFPHAELVKFEGSGHGFFGDAGKRAIDLAIDFVKKNVKQPEEGSDK